MSLMYELCTCAEIGKKLESLEQVLMLRRPLIVLRTDQCEKYFLVLHSEA